MTLGDFASSIVLVFWGWAARDSRIKVMIQVSHGKKKKRERW